MTSIREFKFHSEDRQSFRCLQCNTVFISRSFHMLTIMHRIQRHISTCTNCENALENYTIKIDTVRITGYQEKTTDSLKCNNKTPVETGIWSKVVKKEEGKVVESGSKSANEPSSEAVRLPFDLVAPPPYRWIDEEDGLEYEW